MAFLATMATLPWTMHERANAKPVKPTWQQLVVTVDDERAVELARQWDAPFAVEYAADADITVSAVSHADLVAGEATRSMDGDRIGGCMLTVENPSDVVMLHELGHCFGLHHDNGHSDSLMYWMQGGDSGAAGVTEHDRAELRDLYAR
ncbi:matrixin family metalloprotease [Knoellia locipacati]|uniref:matrixin family metalloprotease n=1 Tax=Knoellia locipacati TaxID=882824 RepID=UPI00384E1469